MEWPGEADRLDEPVVPKLTSEDLRAELMARAEELIVAEDRLEALLRATQRIVGELDLDVVLRRVVHIACDLVGAPYGALGVLSPGGRSLQQFVHAGISDATVATIGHLPEGKGLLGALIDDPRPIRLREISADPRSVGFPEGHPPMKGFLGVPIRLKDEIFGNLYLARDDDQEFTAADQEMIAALAATASLVITGARLYEESNRRQQWLEASAEVTRQLLTADGDALNVFTARVKELSGADLVALALPTPGGDEIQLAVVVGLEEQRLTGFRYPAADSMTERVIATHEPLSVPDAMSLNAAGTRTVHVATAVPLGPVALVPLAATGDVHGVLQVARVVGAAPFTVAEIEMLCRFAVHADLALELAEAQREAQRMTMFDERARIARDLHDHVIQQLFAAGMIVENVRADLPDTDAASTQLDGVVETLDDAIRQIRTSIFQLKPTSAHQSVRMTVLDAVRGAARALGFEPRVHFTGPVDSLSDAELVHDVAAVVREALTNVAKHAHASVATVEVGAGAGQLKVCIADDGDGMPPTAQRSGLANLAERAAAHGGSFTVTPGADGGTVMTWTASTAGQRRRG